MSATQILSLALFALPSLVSAGHALLTKRDSRSALGWIAVCLTFPLAGPLLYLLFGINRIRRSAQRMRQARAHGLFPYPAHTDGAGLPDSALHPRRLRLARIGSALLDTPLAGGNCVQILHDGDEAYPTMLAAIDQAERCVYLASYIFAADTVGRRFAQSLLDAHHRGVDVRIIVDGVGELYGWPSILPIFQRHGVPAIRFLPPRILPPEIHLNLRNHRKILFVDGHTAFTGGMNISERNVRRDGHLAITDVHFRIQGPAARQLGHAFVQDWFLATQEQLTLPPATADMVGDSVCRAVASGPDQIMDVLLELWAGLLCAARKRIRIMTPYFLPPREIFGALHAARLRGVEVEIFLPEHCNIPFVAWATAHVLEGLLMRGIQCHLVPDPFCHAKLFLIDDDYAHVGSANWDCRSLALNFELGLEIFDPEVCTRLHCQLDTIRSRCHRITMEDIRTRPLPVRMRDALFWLFGPYL